MHLQVFTLAFFTATFGLTFFFRTMVVCIASVGEMDSYCLIASRLSSDIINYCRFLAVCHLAQCFLLTSLVHFIISSRLFH